ncbi:MAG: cation transporter [Rhodospirillaceae bacterium]|nr:cation transporter [Rhodospirillaceae bacterium]
MPNLAQQQALRRAVIWVIALNLGYFFIEFGVALTIESVSLFADSVDFLEDSAVNTLILFALGWTARKRAAVGMTAALILLLPAAATLWTAWHQFSTPVVPAPLPLSLTGSGAFIVNLSCALMIARFRNVQGSLTKAAFLSARNDVLANVAIIIAGLITSITPSHWPDLVVGVGILLINLDAAAEVFEAAKKERDHTP